MNIDKQFPPIVDTGNSNPETDWDSLGEAKLGAAERHSLALGVELEPEETVLVTAQLNGKDVPIEGRAFSGERLPIMPVRLSADEIEHGWMALGMQSRKPDHDVEESKEQAFIVMAKIGENNQNLIKVVPAEAQEALLKELETKSSPKTLREKVANLSDEDQEALRLFAMHAANKRDAQKGNYGGESMAHSTRMGGHLNAMSPAARLLAERYARMLYGPDNVAF